MGKLEEKTKQLDDLHFRILPAANKIYDQAFDEVVKLGKIEKKIKQQRIRAVELRDSAGKELSNWREKLEKVTKEYRTLKDESDKFKKLFAENLFRDTSLLLLPPKAYQQSIAVEAVEDMVKQMSAEEIKKRISLLEKLKNLKAAELEFSIAKEAYCVAVKSL